MPDSRPRIVFNDEGVCNACTHSDEKKKINWEKRKNDLYARFSFCRKCFERKNSL